MSLRGEPFGSDGSRFRISAGVVTGSRTLCKPYSSKSAPMTTARTGPKVLT
jgi:hypothetical protein